jgi:predicted enzyme related to lactoylglutathione lyase
MSITHDVAVIWFPVTDIDRAVDFYENALGLELKQREDQWAELEAGSVRIGLNQAESPAGDGGGVLAFQPSGGIDSAVDELKAAGVELDGDGISDHPWGRIAAFRDPDGNALQLYEAPKG